MEEQLKKFLLKCGHPQDVIDQLSDEENPADVEKLAKEFKQAQQEVYENDPTFIKKIQGEIRGKERGSVERKIMKVLGVTAEEAKEHGLEEDYEKLITFGKEKLSATKNKPLEDLQKELQDANIEIKKYKDEVIPAIKSESQAKIDEFYLDNAIGRLINDSGELIVKPHVARTVINDKLKALGYKKELTDGELKILTKDGLTPQDKDKTRNLSREELIKGILEDEGLLKQSKADPSQPPKQFSTPEPKEDVYERLPHLKAAEENEKALQDMKKGARGFAQFQK